MRPENLKSKIFLDSGDPDQTREILELLGFLDGQTTNPTLISKNEEAAKRLAEGHKFRQEEIFNFYQKVVGEISKLIPQGSVSVEVYSDKDTTAKKMLNQGREMYSWIDNAHIKFPTTKEGLIAAEQAVKEGMRINMTLCFSQEQAAAVYAATKGAKKGRAPLEVAAPAPLEISRSINKHRLDRSLTGLAVQKGLAPEARARLLTGQVFVSPFIGRLDDKGENGMQLIENILRMFENGDSHVQVLTASVRNLNHFLYAIKLGSDIITAPFSVLKEWGEKGLVIPEDDFTYEQDLAPIPYKEIDLNKNWQEFNIFHELTEKGIQKFSDDWNSLIT